MDNVVEGTSSVNPHPGLSNEPDILARFAEAVEARGVVGEVRTVKLLYLAITSRLFDEACDMTNIITKAASSTGKSYVALKVLEFFTRSLDYFPITSMSPKSLAYAKDIDLRHKTLFIGEASGLGSQEGAISPSSVPHQREGVVVTIAFMGPGTCNLIVSDQ